MCQLCRTAAATAVIHPSRVNRYAGNCERCQDRVPAGVGWLIVESGKVRVYHRGCLQGLTDYPQSYLALVLASPLHGEEGDHLLRAASQRPLRVPLDMLP